MGKYRKAYTLYKRKLTGKRRDKGDRQVWYYQTYNSQGHRTAGISTGKTTRGEAEQHCDKLLRQGRLVPAEAPQLAEAPKLPTLREWAESEHWWQWGKCRYLRAQLARSDEEKPAVSRRYADDAHRDLQKWILPYHGDKRLDEITPKDCEALLFTWQDEGLSKKSINNRASIYRIMMGEAERLGVIPRTPWDRVKGFKPADHRKGVLTLDEARLLLNPTAAATTWRDQKTGRFNQVYYSANLLASVTGMRLGEILALRRGDLFPDHVHVAGSWAIKYGLGKTKTKRVDDIPIPKFIYDTVHQWCSWQGFVFSFSAGARPATGNRVLEALYRALDEIGIKAEERERRNITFHSWRAFANTYMRARGIADAKVRQLTRHTSEEMTEHYSAFKLEDFKDVAAAQEALVASFSSTE
jgi:integrase